MHTNSIENPTVIQEEMQDSSNPFDQQQQTQNNIDINSKEKEKEKKKKKKVARGQRFGVNSSEDNTDTQHHQRRWDNKNNERNKRPHQQQQQPLSADSPQNFRVSTNAIEDEKLEDKVEQPVEVPRRMDALYLHGTDRMSTEDVFDIFVCGECDGCEQGVLCLDTPSKVEWINDSSCNAIFSTPEITLKIFTKADTILPTISQVYALHANTTSNTENDPTTQTDTQIHSETETQSHTQTPSTTTQQTITDIPNSITLTPAEQIFSSWRTKKTSFGKISLRYATVLDIRPEIPKPSLYYARMWNSKRNGKNKDTKRAVFNHKNNHNKKKNNNKKRENEDGDGENMEDDENVFITLDGQSQTTGSTPTNTTNATNTINTNTETNANANANTNTNKKKKKKNKNKKNKKRKMATMDIDEGNNNNSQASETQIQTQGNPTTLTPTLTPLSQAFQLTGGD